jgi:hypothetical protein
MVDRLSYTEVRPHRFGVPLVGELDPVNRGMAGVDDRQVGVALRFLGDGPLQRGGEVGCAVFQHRQAGRAFGHALDGGEEDAFTGVLLAMKTAQQDGFGANVRTLELGLGRASTAILCRRSASLGVNRWPFMRGVMIILDRDHLLCNS